MKSLQFIIIGLLGLLLPTDMAFADDSAQDADLAIAPVVRQYPVTQLSTSSSPAVFTITNRHASEGRALGTIVLAGANANEFLVGTHSCSDITLSAGESCSVPVSFHPLSRGTKNAELRVPSFDTVTPVLTAYLTNLMSSAVQAQERMPSVLASSAVPETLQAGQQYTLSWTLEGYHDDYTSYAVLFDCTGESDCGASYDDASKFAESAEGPPTSVAPGNWTYRGAATQLFTYEWNFTVPLTREDGSDWAAGGTDIVVRFYNKSNIDVERNSASVSLLIPGNPSLRYYDTSGRRILKTVLP